MYSLSKRSKARLEGVHHDLVRVVERAIQITETDFTVLEGLRSLERQAELLRMGKTRTMKSRHLTGHAVDIAALVDGVISWNTSHYMPIAKAMKNAAADLGIKLQWGGDWRTFKDYVHWQLPWRNYPE